MLTNTEFTIFNQFPDRQSKKMVYVPHYIDAVWFHTDQKTDIVDGGLTSKDVHKIQILMRNVESGCRKMDSRRRSPFQKTGQYRTGICSLLENGPVERSTESRN